MNSQRPLQIPAEEAVANGENNPDKSATREKKKQVRVRRLDAFSEAASLGPKHFNIVRELASQSLAVQVRGISIIGIPVQILPWTPTQLDPSNFCTPDPISGSKRKNIEFWHPVEDPVTQMTRRSFRELANTLTIMPNTHVLWDSLAAETAKGTILDWMRYDRPLNFMTDGTWCQTTGNGGAAVIYQSQDGLKSNWAAKGFALKHCANSMVAEAVGVLEALSWTAELLKPSTRQLRIFVDNLAVLDMLRRLVDGTLRRKTQVLWPLEEALKELRALLDDDKLTISFFWCPSHEGAHSNLGNDMADCVAAASARFCAAVSSFSLDTPARTKKHRFIMEDGRS